MKNIILVIGAGNMGFRHIEGMLKSKFELNIFVIDKSKKVLEIIKKKVSNKNINKNIKLYYSNQIDKFSEKIKCAIISTNSDVRKKVILDLINKNKIENIILEKIAFTNINDYKKVLKIVKIKKINCYINYPRKFLASYSLLKNELNKKRSIIFKIIGNKWGLASNSFHFVDLFSFLIDNNKITVKNNQLEKKLYHSKRKLFYECRGILEFKSSNNHTLFCIDNNFYDKPKIIIETNDCIYFISENENKIIKIDFTKNINIKIKNFNFPQFSENTLEYINRLILNQKLNLSSLEYSFNHYVLLLKLFSSHFRKIIPNIKDCPIT